MLEIGKNNLFCFNNTSSLYGILEVLNFYDVDGINWVYLYNSNYSLIENIISNRIYKINNKTELYDKINEIKYKTDLLVIFFDSFIVSKTRDLIRSINDLNDLSIIILHHNVINDRSFDYKYYFFEEKKESTLSPLSAIRNPVKFGEIKNINIKNMFTNEIYNIESLKKSIIRDRKIEKIISDDETS